MSVNFQSSLWTKQARKKKPSCWRPVHCVQWRLDLFLQTADLDSLPEWEHFPASRLFRESEIHISLIMREGGGKERGYHLKGKRWHPLVIKELYPYPHKALPDTLLLSFQSLERTAALISAHAAGQAATAPWRGWDVPKPWRTRPHNGVAGLPLRSHPRLSGSSEAAPGPGLLSARLCWIKDCWFTSRQEEMSQRGLLSPALPGRDGIQLQT